MQRSVEQIPPQEIELAVLHLAEEQFGVSRDEVPHGVAMMFGIERARAEAASTIRDVTDYLIDELQGHFVIETEAGVRDRG